MSNVKIIAAICLLIFQATRKVSPLKRLLCVFGSDSVASRLKGPKKKAAFQIVLKRRAHMLLIASVGV